MKTTTNCVIPIPTIEIANAETPVTRTPSPTVNPRTSAEVRRTWPRAITARAQ